MYQLRTTTKNGEVAIHSDCPALQKTWGKYILSPTQQSGISATNYTTEDAYNYVLLGGCMRKMFTLWMTGMLPLVE